MDAGASEEPKAKRPCLEDEKQSTDREDTGENSVVDSILFPPKREVRIDLTVISIIIEGSIMLLYLLQGGPRFAKRRKCILLMAYNGKGYLGMQK